MGFSYLVFLDKKEDKNFFSIDIGYFLDQQSYRHQVKNMPKVFGSFLLELVNLMTETKYGVHGFVNFRRLM